MAGGTWESQNKVRPGAYINFQSNDQSLNVLDSAGTLVIPLALDWGEVGKFIRLTPNTNFKELFGKTLANIIPIREAFKATSDVLVYNLSGAGVKATATSGDLVAKAVHGGTDGNKITVLVTKGLTDYTVKTLYDGEQVDSQVVTVASELVSNAYATFSGTLPIGDATLTFASGTTVAASAEAYADFAEALDTQNFKVVAFGTDDESIKLLFALKVKQWREEQGKNVTFVTNDYNAADYKGTVSVLNHVVLTGNEKLSVKDSVYWYGGAYAASTFNSLTYAQYPGAIDVERKTHDEIVQALQNGHIVYTYNAGADGVDRIVVESDINTFRSFTAEENQDFRKNKIIRAMDFLSNNVQHVYSRFFIGKVNNDANGLNLFKGQVMTVVLDSMVRRGAIDPYSPEDITVIQGLEKDAVDAVLGIKFNDAMEKLYMTVKCR